MSSRKAKLIREPVSDSSLNPKPQVANPSPQLNPDFSPFGEVYQIATGVETDVITIAKMIADLAAEEGIEVTIKHTQEMKGEIRKNYSDITKARKILNFEPAVSFDNGLKNLYKGENWKI